MSNTTKPDAGSAQNGGPDPAKAPNRPRSASSRSILARRLVRSAGPAAIACGLMLAACGSSKPHSTTKSKSYVTGVKYAQCMRAHGVPNFPDPTPQGGISSSALSIVEKQSPALSSAQHTCQKLEPHGGPPPGSGFNEQQLQQMIAKARCIRDHGFPSFPDPDASGDNIGRGTMPPGWNPFAPAETKARKTCAKVGSVIPGWVVSWSRSGSAS